jgi:hypothetical protein
MKRYSYSTTSYDYAQTGAIFLMGYLISFSYRSENRGGTRWYVLTVIFENEEDANKLWRLLNDTIGNIGAFSFGHRR